MATLPGFKRLPGRSERFLVVATGQEISRRKYDLIRRGLSNEDLARINKATELQNQLARPARGRKSVLKAPDFIKQEVVSERIAESTKKEILKKVEKQQKKIDRDNQRLTARQVKVPKFSGRLLKAGRKARRVPFNDYDEYVTFYGDMKKSKIVFAYSLGIAAVDTRIGRERDAIVFPMRTFDGLLSEDEFQSYMDAFLESHAYLEFMHYFIHIAFSAEYYERKAK
jgi:hypothetical protein